MAINHLILVDGNNLGFAANSAGPRLHAGNKETHATFSVIRTIRTLFLDNPMAFIMILWDGKSWRHNISSDYKGNREKTIKQVSEREAYYNQKNSLVKGLHLLGVTQCSASNMEADDLAQIYSSKWQGDKITLYSADKDWLQLVDKRTTWIDPIRDRQCNHLNFRAFTSCENREEFLERKYLLGDMGDNIKGAEGVGEKTLEKLYSIWSSVDEFYSDLNREEKWKAAFARSIPKSLENYDAIFDALSKNESLMNLSTIFRPAPINMVRKRQNLDAESFRAFCYENAFLSLLKDYDRFLRPFKENTYVRVGQTSEIA